MGGRWRVTGDSGESVAHSHALERLFGWKITTRVKSINYPGTPVCASVGPVTDFHAQLQRRPTERISDRPRLSCVLSRIKSNISHLPPHPTYFILMLIVISLYFYFISSRIAPVFIRQRLRHNHRPKPFPQKPSA
jgi:hypothetical protein